MIQNKAVEFAKIKDAGSIARLSRDLIEFDLPWTWQPPKVARCIYDKSHNVVVHRSNGRVAGFGIMAYELQHAHLCLFAVDSSMQLRGIGHSILWWLEETALVAGIDKIYLETRLQNESARCFYQNRGYANTEKLLNYYSGREHAIRMTKVLRKTPDITPQ